MFTQTLFPRFSETDALGHINNASLPVWFEEARTPIFEIFNPSLDPSIWNLILARIQVDFKAQIFYGKEVTIQTQIARLGNSSFDIQQDAYQNKQLVAQGLATMVCFDYEQQCSTGITEPIRNLLEKHLIA